MGNKDSKSSHHHDGHSAATSINAADNEQRHGHAAALEAAYQRWNEQHGGVNSESIERVFGPILGRKIWHYFDVNVETKNNVSFDVFVNRLSPLIFGYNLDVWLRMLAGEDGRFSGTDLSEFIHICRACSGVQFDEKTDGKIIDAVIAAVTSDTTGEQGTTVDQLKIWMENTCPRLMSSVRQTVITGFQTATTHCDRWNGSNSRLVSAMTLWLLQCCVPSNLIRPDASGTTDDASVANNAIWDVLYSSEDDGLSANRFETKVFNYRSPTVMMTEDTTGARYCVCVDEEWKYSTHRWGKSGCYVYGLYPRWELLESGGSADGGMIFFNMKQRGYPQGLFVGSNPKNPLFTIDAEFSNVRSIEVWGCGSRDSYLAQQNQRQWEKGQVEKQQKVPLPGNWEDSPDRMLLEMGGVKTQHAER